ncbi:hypothetical protein AALB19_06400 [Oscillospiraceae bacterium 50-58]
MQALQVLEHLVEPAVFLYFVSIIPWNGWQCKPTLPELFDKLTRRPVFWAARFFKLFRTALAICAAIG